MQGLVEACKAACSKWTLLSAIGLLAVNMAISVATMAGMTYAFSHEGKKKPSLGVDLLAMATLMAGAEWVGVCTLVVTILSVLLGAKAWAAMLVNAGSAAAVLAYLHSSGRAVNDVEQDAEQDAAESARAPK